MRKKSYYSNEVYTSLHSKMYMISSCSSESNRNDYRLYLVNSSPTSDDVKNDDVYVSITQTAARDFLHYTLSPCRLINLFAHLCILSGKNIVKL